MTVEPEQPDQPSPPPARRRLVGPTESADRQGRSGCLITGAILGIIVGATFAFYGLPPILKHFYGEKHIAVGQSYEGDAKVMQMTSVEVIDQERVVAESPNHVVVVRFSVSSNKTWRPKPSDFSLEYEHGGDWVEAGDISNGGFDSNGGGFQPLEFDVPQLGQQYASFAAFPIQDASRGAPKYLHLAEPRVRFALPPLKQP